MSDFLTNINERIEYHRNSLNQWISGHLVPTEPDEEERACIIRGLEAAIGSLEIAKKEYEADSLVQGLRVLFQATNPDQEDLALHTLVVNVKRSWTPEMIHRFIEAFDETRKAEHDLYRSLKAVIAPWEALCEGWGLGDVTPDFVKQAKDALAAIDKREEHLR